MIWRLQGRTSGDNDISISGIGTALSPGGVAMKLSIITVMTIFLLIPYSITDAGSNRHLYRSKSSGFAGKKIVIEDRIFNSRSAVIKMSSYPTLNKYVEILKRRRNRPLTITAYTDAYDDRAMNLKLSSERADGLRDYFVSKGISSSRIKAIGFGDISPGNTAANSTAHISNRRVEVVYK
jgi:outer membrane protein OmpA-like peptidoglycan-associated protein